MTCSRVSGPSVSAVSLSLGLPFRMEICVFYLLGLGQRGTYSSDSPLRVCEGSLVFGLIPLPTPHDMEQVIP